MNHLPSKKSIRRSPPKGNPSRKSGISGAALAPAFLFLLGVFLGGPVFADPENPFHCLSPSCHLPTIQEALASNHIHPPLATQGSAQICVQCHVDEQPSHPSGSTGRLSSYVGQPTLAHQITVTGLAPQTTYYYRVKSTDRDGNEAVAPIRGAYHFTTGGSRQPDGETGARLSGIQDTTPPRITAVRVEKISRGILMSAVVAWHTDEPSDSQVEYGVQNVNEKMTPQDPTLLRQHRVLIPGLSPGRAYMFRVKSSDAAGNTSVSEAYTFSTRQESSGVRIHGGIQNVLASLSRRIAFSRARADSPLTITNVRVTHTGAESATVMWSTGRPADSRIDYGIRPESLESEAFFHLPLKTERKMTMDGCYGCHPSLLKGLSHPVGIYPEATMKVSPELPTIENGMITCVTCHHPHAGPETYLLRKNWKRELCIHCHDPNDL